MPRSSAEIPGWTVWTGPMIGGESLAALAARADRVIATLLPTGGDVLVFAHGHFLRVLAARWIEAGPIGASRLELWTATVSELGWEQDRRVIEVWNAGSAGPPDDDRPATRRSSLGSASDRPPARMRSLAPPRDPSPLGRRPSRTGLCVGRSMFEEYHAPWPAARCARHDPSAQPTASRSSTSSPSTSTRPRRSPASVAGTARARRRDGRTSEWTAHLAANRTKPR